MALVSKPAVTLADLDPVFMPEFISAVVMVLALISAVILAVMVANSVLNLAVEKKLILLNRAVERNVKYRAA